MGHEDGNSTFDYRQVAHLIGFNFCGDKNKERRNEQPQRDMGIVQQLKDQIVSKYQPINITVNVNIYCNNIDCIPIFRIG
jgi:hypothetical protein